MGRILLTPYPIQDLCKIYKVLKISKIKQSNENWNIEKKRKFLIMGIQMAKKHLNKYTISLAIRENK